MALFILALVAPALLGAVLLFQGIRGKPVPGTNVCRGCKFDLSGLPSAQACPECGTPLSGPGAIVPRRQTSRFRTAIGVFLLLAPLLLGTVLASASLAKVNLNTYKPVWLLRAEAHGLSLNASDAIAELLRRYRAGELTGVIATTIVKQALPLADTDPATWNTAWSDLIAIARSDGLVTDAQWAEYVCFAIDTELACRRVVRQNQPAPFGYILSGPRLAASPPAAAEAIVRTQFEEMSIDGVPFDRVKGGTSAGSISRTGTSSSSRAFPVDAPLGKHRLKAIISVSVISDFNSNREFGRKIKSVEREIEVVPANASIVSAKAAPSLDAAVRRSVTIPSFRKERNDSLEIQVRSDSPPVELAFEVLVRPRDGSQSGKEFSVGNASFRPGSSMIHMFPTDRKFDATRFDLILRPSASAAEANYLLNEYWTGPDLVYEDVKAAPKWALRMELPKTSRSTSDD